MNNINTNGMKTMKKIITGGFIAAALTFALAGPASAGPVTSGSTDPGSQSTATSAWFKLSSSGNTTSHNYYVGPYTAFRNATDDFSVTAGLDEITLFCVDARHESKVNEIWQAYITPLVGSGSLDGRTRGGDGALQQYEEAAWLAERFANNSTDSRAAIHSAIWKIMGYSPFTVNGTQDWIDQAAEHYDDASVYGHYAVVTPVDFDTGGTQEYLTRISVPEPGALGLFGLGLFGLGLAVQRRKRRG
jgi:hypothetical protein